MQGAWSKDRLKVIGPSGKCHSPQIFQSHHHERGATSDLLHDPRDLLVKLRVTLDRASTTVYKERLPWDMSDMTFALGLYPIHTYLHKLRLPDTQ